MMPKFNRLVRRSFDAGRSLTVLLALIALIVGGATAAQRQADMAEARAEAERETGEADRLAATPDAGKGEMAPGGAPNVEPAAWLISTTTLVKTSDNDSRLRPQLSTTIRRHLPAGTADISRPLLPSSSRVATSLGRQFTLVGAKPSGTS
ncbi:hypothetical protein GF420_10095 [candidate division GN15 bacterium]|nr:hypothetical protein [candidate division GN15 bacterium]